MARGNNGSRGELGANSAIIITATRRLVSGGNDDDAFKFHVCNLPVVPFLRAADRQDLDELWDIKPVESRPHPRLVVDSPLPKP